MRTKMRPPKRQHDTEIMRLESEPVGLTLGGILASEWYFFNST